MSYVDDKLTKEYWQAEEELNRYYKKTPQCIPSTEGYPPEFVEMNKKQLEKADRFNSGKLKWSLVDWKSMEPLVKVLEFGAKKYSADNWKKGLNRKEILESAIRHLMAMMDGEELDKESGLPHQGHVQCNMMFYDYMINNGLGLD